MRRVARVREEAEVARAGLLEAGDATDLDLAVAEQLAAEPLGQLAEPHAPALSRPSRGTAARQRLRQRASRERPGLAGCSPALTEPLSQAPSRTTSTRASTVPCTRAFSAEGERAGLARRPCSSPAISSGVGRDRGLDLRALGDHQAAGERDLAPEAALDDRVLALQLALEVRLRVDDRDLLIRHVCPRSWSPHSSSRIIRTSCGRRHTAVACPVLEEARPVTYTYRDIAKMIDHSLLQPDADRGGAGGGLPAGAATTTWPASASCPTT